MSIGKAIGIVVGLSFLFSLLNFISMFMWFRMNMSSHDSPLIIDPAIEAFVKNLGTSITQGFFMGAVVGLVLVFLFIWRELTLAKIQDKTTL